MPQFDSTRTRILPALVTCLFLAACSSLPTVSVRQPVADDAEIPFGKVLVVALFDSFDPRRYLEEEIVERLAASGTEAVRSTSMMDSRTPVVPQTFIDMVDEVGADSVLVIQLTGLRSVSSEEDASPEATMNYWPTYYFNVFEVQLTEYVEPPRINIEHTLVLATQMYSVATRAPVWGIESRSIFTELQEDGLSYSIYEDEAEAIVRAMRRDGLVSR